MWIITTTFFIIFADQISKFVISKNLDLAQHLPVVEGFFYISLVKNFGAIFGLFQNTTFILIIISILSIIIISILLYRSKRIFRNRDFWFQLGLVLILGGAIGNLIDRIRLGYVIDFLNFLFWPVFNLADSSITIGIGILAFKLFKNK